MEVFPPASPDMTSFNVAVTMVTILAVILIVGRIGMWLMSDGESETDASSQNVSVIKEREIIREIIKIRCSYCGNLYDEKEDKCPHCGGKRPEFEKA